MFGKLNLLSKLKSKFFFECFNFDFGAIFGYMLEPTDGLHIIGINEVLVWLTAYIKVTLGAI
jgi:hypothetical protein